MRAAGAALLAVGLVLALIAGVWGRSGFYAEQAPILLLLALAGLGSLGAGLGMLRYQRASLPTAGETVSSIFGRAVAASAPPVAGPSAPVVKARDSSVDEATRDRPPRTSDWVLRLPDGTDLPIADALVIGRQPVSSDRGPTAAVPSPEVSKSHARFQIVGGQLLVRDLDTTNGTVIVRSDETEERASSTVETPIGDGDRLEIGSYVLTVERRP